MKFITCLAFIVLCSCGADGAPEKPLSLGHMGGAVAINRGD